MKTEIELSAEQLKALERYCRITHTSHEQVIQQALLCFLPGNFPSRKNSLKEYPAFGIWSDRPVDALAYQQSLREEWPEL
jgi:hypothetical protein